MSYRDNDKNFFVDDMPEMDELNPIDFDSPEAKIELVNRAYNMRHRSEPYILNDPNDFSEYMKYLSATYMDYSYYSLLISDLLENHLITIETTNMALWNNIKSGDADYIIYRDNHPNEKATLEASECLTAAQISIIEIVDRARRNLEACLDYLFSAVPEFQQTVMGKSYQIPEPKRKNIAHSLTENIDELGFYYNMEANFETFIAHIKNTMENLLVSNIPIEKKPIQEGEAPKISITVKKEYDRTDLKDLKDMFLISVGRCLDHLGYWMEAENIFELYDETLEHADASTYANIYILHDDSDTLTSEFLSDMRSIVDNLNEQYDLSQAALKDLLLFIFQSDEVIQKSILGQSYTITEAKMESVLQSIFDTITDVEGDYVMEQSRDSFLTYLHQELEAHI